MTEVRQAQSRRRLAQDVVETLEASILSGELPVGAKLPSEEQLANDLAVGRRPVREALKVLETKGLIEVHMGVGAVVRRHDFDEFLESLSRNLRTYGRINPADVVHVVELRLLLEGAPLNRVAETGDESTLVILSKAVSGQRDAVSRGDAHGYQEWHFKFHQQLVDSYRNPIVSMLYQHVMALMRPPMERAGSIPNEAELAIADHERLVTVARNGTKEEIDAALRTHFDHFLAAMVLPGVTTVDDGRDS